MGNLTVKESGEMVNFISPNVSNITSFKVHFSPKQEGSGDPSPENVREITGWNGVEGYSSGKNLFGGEAFESAVHSSVIFEDAQYGKYLRTYNITSGNPIFTMSFKENTQYTFIGKIRRESTSVITGLRIKYTDGSTTHLFADTSSEANEVITVRAVSSKTKTLDGLYYLQRTVGCHIFFNYFGIFEGDVPIDNFEPYQGATTSTDWTEDVGTIYGGYVDLIGGELVQEYAYKRVDANLGVINYATSRIRYIVEDMYLINSDDSYSDPTYTCNMFPKTKATSVAGIRFTRDNENTTAFILFQGIDSFGIENTLEAWNNFTSANEIYITYRLATPITHQLTPQQLSTLKGQNNFWSNADYIEIEYELTETFDIQKAKRKIILNQPHVESASGDIVTFDTDMRGKLKECKVYFSPVQEGEGDPSPDNVRNIVGWNGVSVGLPSEYQEVEYIESTGTQWINTGVIGKPNIEVNAKFELTDSTNIGNCGLIGSRESGSATRFYIISFYRNCWHLGLPDDKTTTSYPININQIQDVIFKYTNGNYSLIVDNTEVFTGQSTIATTYPMYLFGVNNYGTVSRLGSFKLYSLIIQQDGTLVRNFIPCYRKSDNEIGMYDTVSKQFFTNQGTGTFIKGDDVDRIHGSIDWTNDVGTIYGGYVDLVSGELVQTWQLRQISELGIKKTSGTGIWEHRFDMKYWVTGYGYEATGAFKCLADCFTLGLADHNNSFLTYAGNISVYDDTVSTADEFKAKYGQNYIAYEIKSDLWQTHQLTPQQLTAIRGANTIYSNTNGQTEIKYWKH